MRGREALLTELEPLTAGKKPAPFAKLLQAELRKL